jgi:hypothetical protein
MSVARGAVHRDIKLELRIKQEEKIMQGQNNLKIAKSIGKGALAGAAGGLVVSVLFTLYDLDRFMYIQHYDHFFIAAYIIKWVMAGLAAGAVAKGLDSALSSAEEQNNIGMQAQ